MRVNLQNDRRLRAKVGVNLSFERGLHILYGEPALFGIVPAGLQSFDVLCGRSADGKEAVEREVKIILSVANADRRGGRPWRGRVGGRGRSYWIFQWRRWDLGRRICPAGLDLLFQRLILILLLAHHALKVFSHRPL